MWVYKQVPNKRTGETKRAIVWEDIKVPSMDGENPEIKAQDSPRLPEAAKPAKGKK